MFINVVVEHLHHDTPGARLMEASSTPAPCAEVAAPCEEIAADPSAAALYTSRQNVVAVISNGTAVLGLGDIGALASKPVMEGKAVRAACSSCIYMRTVRQ